MDIILLQTDTQWHMPEQNRAHIRQMIDSASPADLIVLPEMFTTGFCAEPEQVAEHRGSTTLEWMRSTAKAKNAAITGSIVVEEDGKYTNRMYFVYPDGSCLQYSKWHLFSFAGEHHKYTAGNQRQIIMYRGFRILLQICYDLRFPVFSRNCNDYDMIVYVANWPIPRIHAWHTLLAARAIENQAYVVGVNRVGADPAAQYNGGSTILNFIGKPIAEAQTNAEETITGKVDMTQLNEFRKKFPAMRDADKFNLLT
jgi:predicted amidohydrolase